MRANTFPLLLPAPAGHRCFNCDAGEIFEGGYWVESIVRDDLSGFEPIRFERCNDCEESWQANHRLRTPEISLWRGTTPWSEHSGYEGWEHIPFICVSDASNEDWEHGRHHERETWLFFRNREEWRAAYRLAREIKSANGPGWRRVFHEADFIEVAAYKPAGSDLLNSRFRDGKEGR